MNSKGIFLSVFADIVPCGDYYKKKETMKLIEDSDFKKKQKEMKDKNIKDVFLMFAKINVSPVTISKSQDIKYLKNLYSYLCE